MKNEWDKTPVLRKKSNGNPPTISKLSASSNGFYRSSSVSKNSMNGFSPRNEKKSNGNDSDRVTKSSIANTKMIAGFNKTSPGFSSRKPKDNLANNKSLDTVIKRSATNNPNNVRIIATSVTKNRAKGFSKEKEEENPNKNSVDKIPKSPIYKNKIAASRPEASNHLKNSSKGLSSVNIHSNFFT